jgi:hypothetical protein
MTCSIWRRTSLLPLLFLYHKRNAFFHFCNLSAAALASFRTRHNREAPAPGCREGSVAQTHPPPATSPVWPAAAVCRVWCILPGNAGKPSTWLQRTQPPALVGLPFALETSTAEYKVVHAATALRHCPPTSQPGQPPGSAIEAIILVPCHPSASLSVHSVALAMRSNHRQSDPPHAPSRPLSL